jgi:hypothetical protein
MWGEVNDHDDMSYIMSHNNDISYCTNSEILKSLKLGIRINPLISINSNPASKFN